MTVTVTVLGAGAGGLAAAVELTLAGHRVRLWNRNAARLAPHRADGIRYRGVFGAGTVAPQVLSDDLAHALDGADVVVACLPSVVHPQLFADLATSRCTAPVILNPGHTGGALHLRHVFDQAGVALPPVAEFSTLTYIGRVNDGVVDITGRSQRVSVGALPGGLQARSFAIELFPGSEAAPDVLASSLANVNLVLHPPGAVLSAAWVEATDGAFTFYVDAMTDGVARVVDRLDVERLAVARAFGHELPSLLAEMAALGTAEPTAAARGQTAAAIRGGVANSRILAPDSLDHRYYREDFAFGLLPFLELATVAGVDTPVAAALLEVGDALVGGLRDTGLDADRLGLRGMSRESLIASVRERE